MTKSDSNLERVLRAGNFAVQNADLVLIVGSRMSIPQVGYNYKLFARGAKKIMVDIDEIELKKPSLRPDLPICADAGRFLRSLLAKVEADGVRLEPHVSDPMAKGTRPAATALPGPLEEPPDQRVRSHGLSPGPVSDAEAYL